MARGRRSSSLTARSAAARKKETAPAEAQRQDEVPSRERVGRYRIGAVSEATGISAHTLRVWERRYGAFSLSRTDGGVRLYSDADVERLHRLRKLQEQGHAIGQIAHLPDDELVQLLSEGGLPRSPEAGRVANGTVLPALGGGFERVRETFLESVRAFDLSTADRVLQAAIAGSDLRVLVLELLPPLFEEIGRRWETGAFHVAHEHAASALLRNALGGLQRARSGAEGRGRVVATTLSGELHEFGALLASLLASANGWQVSYLGPNLPTEEIRIAVSRARATAVMVSAVCAERPSSKRHYVDQLEQLRDALPASCEILVGGALAPHLQPTPEGVSILGSLDALERWLVRQ
jgi:DNA-binding transcriptional MerR regulator/methylmalonyl-CoA mutase cobalamin-binding subunit